MAVAILLCGLGHAEGATLSRRLGGWQDISWAAAGAFDHDRDRHCYDASGRMARLGCLRLCLGFLDDAGLRVPVPEEKIERGARHLRDRDNWPLTGILAQRARTRPNRLDVTVCRVSSAEGSRLNIEGLDAIDGTPVIDIKPVVREFLPRDEVRQPEWVSELMAAYW